MIGFLVYSLSYGNTSQMCVFYKKSITLGKQTQVSGLCSDLENNYKGCEMISQVFHAVIAETNLTNILKRDFRGN